MRQKLGWLLAGAGAGLALVFGVLFDAPGQVGHAPEACLNCHPMRSAYAGWSRSSHRSAAGCTDCHLPHENGLRYLAFKGRDGAWDTAVYLGRVVPEVIRLSPGGREVVRDNCLRCHGETMGEAEMRGAADRWCGDCHRETPHGRPGGQAAGLDSWRPPFAPFPEMLSVPGGGDHD